MIYYDYPEEKIEIFEESNRNYFFKGNDFTYLCTYDEVKAVNMWNAFTGFVLVVYKRYAVVKKGEICFLNENFSDGNMARGRYKENGYVIILREPKEYLIHSWKKNLTSYELRDDSTYNCALNPVIFETAEEALAKAVLLSKEEDGAFLVAQWFDEFDRH
jgi:hypothetical protein